MPEADRADAATRAGRARLAWALGITLAIMGVEAAGALLSGSLALLADAGHMLVDSAGLAVALVAARLALRPPTESHTWGWMRSEVVAAAAQAGMLLVICLGVAAESVRRLAAPPEIDAGPMLWVGVAGLVANVASAAILAASRHSSLNLAAAFLEVMNDALGSLAVIAAAIVAQATGWTRADAVASLLIAALMGPRALALLRRAVAVLMERTPTGLDLAEVRRHMLAIPHVEDVHDLHATTIGTGLVDLTAHVTVSEQCHRDGHSLQVLAALQDCVTHHFPVHVAHATFQLDAPSLRRGDVLRHRG